MRKTSFGYKALLRSADLNQRFGDLFGGSILNGFRLHKGTSQFTISIRRDSDEPSVLLTPEGIRLEDEDDAIDAVLIQPNMNAQERFDVIYVNYASKEENSNFTYEVLQGVPGQPIDLLRTADVRMAIGYVKVVKDSLLTDADIHSFPFGLNLRKNIFSEEIQKMVSQSLSEIDDVLEAVTDSSNSTRLIWKSPVDTYSDLLIIYPAPSLGEAVLIRESGKVFRYDGVSWLEILDVNLASISDLENKFMSEIVSNKVFTKIRVPKVLSSTLSASGTIDENTILLNESIHGIVPGDKIGIENAGNAKNLFPFMISFNSAPTTAGSVTMNINGTNYTIEVTTSDTTTTLGAKLVSLNLPYHLVSSGSDVLYNSDQGTTSISIDTGGTGTSVTYKVDNVVEYNYLRATVVSVEGNQLTLDEALVRTVESVSLKFDHTELLQEALNKSQQTDGKIYITTGTYNIFDKLTPMYNMKSLQFFGSGDESVLDFSMIVGRKVSYAFAKNILYYTDGNGITLADSTNVLFEDLKLLGKEQPPVKFTNVSNVTFERVTLEMKKTAKMNNAVVAVYSTAAGRAPETYRFRDCKILSRGMALIFLGDFSNPVRDVKIESSLFRLDADGNYESLNLSELVKIDNNTKDVEISGCAFYGGELSTITIEEGCRNISIHDNEFYDTKNQFIRVAKGQTNLACHNIKIRKNEFTNYVFGITVETSTSGMTVYGLIIEGNTASGKTTSNTSSFLNVRKSDQLRIKDNKILNTDVATASIFLIVDCTNVTIEENDLPLLGNVDIGQVRVITSTGVRVKRNRLATLVLRYVADGHITDNEVMARIGLENNYDVTIRGNAVNIGDYQLVASYYALIQITSTDTATNSGIYQVHFNRLFSTKNAKGITTSPASIVLNSAQNVLQGTV